MLLVTGFKPIQNNYNNQNPNKTNFSQAQFHTKADSVNFKSKSMDALTQKALHEHPELFGQAFKDYMARVNKFLAEHGLMFQHQQCSVRFRTSPKIERTDAYFVFENGGKSTLVTTEGQNIAHVDDSTAVGLTQNDANIDVLEKFFKGKIMLNAQNSRHYDTIRLPEAQRLKMQTLNVIEVLTRFRLNWLEINYPGNRAKKVQDYEAALKTLMPEE